MTSENSSSGVSNVSRKDRLKVAFAIKIAEMVVKADGEVVLGERDLLEEMFPPELLRRLGLDEPEEYAVLRDTALDELPQLLTHDEKLNLIGMFLAVSDADADVDVRELEVIVQAADVLGVGFEEVFTYISDMMSEG